MRTDVTKAQSKAAIALLLTALTFGTPAAAAARKPAPPAFSRYLADLPIMAGLRESRRGSVVQTAGGRRVEVRLQGAVGASTVRSFYSAALPQAGWRRSADQPYLFYRGGEQLSYVVAPRLSASGVEVVFKVAPSMVAEPHLVRP